MLTGSTRSDRCDYLREQYQRGTVGYTGTVWGTVWYSVPHYDYLWPQLPPHLLATQHLSSLLPYTDRGVTGRKTERLDCREGRKEATSVRSFPSIFFLGCLVLPKCFQNVASAVTPPSYNSTLVNSSSEKV